MTYELTFIDYNEGVKITTQQKTLRRVRKFIGEHIQPYYKTNNCHLEVKMLCVRTGGADKVIVDGDEKELESLMRVLED